MGYSIDNKSTNKVDLDRTVTEQADDVNDVDVDDEGEEFEQISTPTTIANSFDGSTNSPLIATSDDRQTIGIRTRNDDDSDSFDRDGETNDEMNKKNNDPYQNTPFNSSHISPLDVSSHIKSPSLGNSTTVDQSTADNHNLSRSTWTKSFRWKFKKSFVTSKMGDSANSNNITNLTSNYHRFTGAQSTFYILDSVDLDSSTYSGSANPISTSQSTDESTTSLLNTSQLDTNNISSNQSIDCKIPDIVPQPPPRRKNKFTRESPDLSRKQTVVGNMSSSNPPPLRSVGRQLSIKLNPMSTTSWYAECGVFKQEALNDKGNVLLKDGEKGKQHSTISWSADAGLYQICVDSVASSSGSSGMSAGGDGGSFDDNNSHSMFSNEPLYQIYSRAKLESHTGGVMEQEQYDGAYEEVDRNDNSGQLVNQTKDGINKYQRPSALRLIELKLRPSITLWCHLHEVISSGILQTLTKKERNLQEAKFEILTSEASCLKSLNLLRSYFMNIRNGARSTFCASDSVNLDSVIYSGSADPISISQSTDDSTILLVSTSPLDTNNSSSNQSIDCTILKIVSPPRRKNKISRESHDLSRRHTVIGNMRPSHTSSQPPVGEQVSIKPNRLDTTLWYDECGGFKQEALNDESNVHLKDGRKEKQHSAISWSADAGLYPTSVAWVASSSESLDVSTGGEGGFDDDINSHSTFSNSPLYQIYSQAKFEVVTQGIMEPEQYVRGYDEAARNNNLCQLVIQRENSIKKYQRPTALRLIELKLGQSLTLWSQLHEVISSGILQTLTKKGRNIPEAKFKKLTLEAWYLKSLNLLRSHFMNHPAFRDKNIWNGARSTFCVSDSVNLDSVIYSGSADPISISQSIDESTISLVSTSQLDTHNSSSNQSIDCQIPDIVPPPPRKNKISRESLDLGRQQHEVLNDEGNAFLSDSRNEKHHSTKSWSADAILYQTSNDSVISPGGNSGVSRSDEGGSDDDNKDHSMFSNEPLYEICSQAKLESVTKDFMEPEQHVGGYDEVLRNNNPDQLVKQKDGPSRSLWSKVHEVISFGIMQTLTKKERNLQEAKFEMLTSEASNLKPVNLLRSCSSIRDRNISNSARSTFYVSNSINIGSGICSDTADPISTSQSINESSILLVNTSQLDTNNSSSNQSIDCSTPKIVSQPRRENKIARESPDLSRRQTAIDNMRPSNPSSQPPVGGQVSIKPNGLDTTSWYSECAVFKQEALNDESNVHLKDSGEEKQYSPISWSADAGIYQTSVDSVASSSGSSGVSTGGEGDSVDDNNSHSMFSNELLNQICSEAKLELVTGGNMEQEHYDAGYEEVSRNNNSGQLIIQREDGIKKYQRPSALQLIEPKLGPSRTLWCQVHEVISSGILQTLTKKERNLQEAKFEILTSEASYLKSLNLLRSHFMNHPAFQDINILSSVNHECLFSQVIPVLECSDRLLCDLESCWQDNIMLIGLPKSIRKNAEKYFHVYIKYCENQGRVDRILKKLRAQKDVFSQTLEYLEEDTVCCRLCLNSFLILPMQRITKFPLLIDAVINQLKNNDEEFDDWKLAFTMLCKIVQQCNEAANRTEQAYELQQISRDIEFPLSITPIPIVPVGTGVWQRVLIRRGELTLWKNDDGKVTFSKKLTKLQKTTKIYAFLFTDLLVLAKKKSDNKYLVTDYCQRSMLTLSSGDLLPQYLTKDHMILRKYWIVMTLLENHAKKSVEMIVSCTSETERLRWIEAIEPPTSQNPDEKIYEQWDCPQVVAIQPYEATQNDEISLDLNDVVNVLRKMGDGWFQGERLKDGKQGWFPGRYTKELLSSHVRARNLKQRHRLLVLSGNYVESQKKLYNIVPSTF